MPAGSPHPPRTCCQHLLLPLSQPRRTYHTAWCRRGAHHLVQILRPWCLPSLGCLAQTWMMPLPGVGAPANQVLPPWAQPPPTGAQPAGMPANPMMPPWLQPTAGATPPGAGATFNYPGATHQPGVAGTGPMVPANPMMPPWAQPQPQPQQPLPVGPSPANVALVEAAADSTAARMPSLAPREAVSTGGTGDVTMHPVSLS